MTSTLNRLFILSGIVGPVIFSILMLLVLPILYPGYDFTHQYISEFGAEASPVASIANIFGFGLVGVSTALFSIGVLRVKSFGVLGKVSAVFIFITGVLMLLVAAYPCDAGCINTSATGLFHEQVSDYQYPIFAIASVLFMFESLRHKKLFWLVPVIAVLGTIALVFGYWYINDLYRSFPGMIQRVSVFSAYLMLMLMAVGVYRLRK